jgi:hypothetical protein
MRRSDGRGPPSHFRSGFLLEKESTVALFECWQLQMVVWSEFGAFRSICRRFWEFVDHFVDEFLRIPSVAN